ncbi:alpha/beta fold hydrolase [Streptomyces yokosukanensis]|uniref:alpha/beta fold hydrolase n=1 Tax=Streptomyces yokosukanensis TaxID=67386 RepID=UPI003443D055
MSVPVNPADPEGRKIGIVVSRLPAADRSKRIGALVWNPGGPGIAGSYVPAAQLPPELAQRFDLIGFDPRGSGRSGAVPGCGEDNAVSEALEGGQGAAAGTAARRYAEACTKKLGALAGYLGTRAMTEDLDAIRAALGEERLSLLMGSYGTLLGQQYLVAHPQHVRAVVLDGTMDPALSGVRAALDASGTAEDKSYTGGNAEEVARQQLQSVLSGFTLWCKNNASHCSVYKDPVGRALAAAGGDDKGRKKVLSAAAAAGYVPERWPELADALDAAGHGDRTALGKLADKGFPEQLKSEAGSTLDLGYNLGVYCTDFAWPGTPAAIADAFHKADKDSSFTAAEYLPCAFWPGRGAPLGAIKVPSATPRPLVINGTDDPRTGISGARTVSQRLGAQLVVFKGRTHVATQGGVECAQRAAARYLVTGSTQRIPGCP